MSKNKMKTSALLFFMFTSKDHVINYVAKFVQLYTGCRMDHRDMRQEIQLSYYKNRIVLPIEKNDPRIKGMFRDMSRRAKHEKRREACLYYSSENVLPVWNDSYENLCTIPDILSTDEKKIYQRLLDGESTYDIMENEQITYGKYLKIKGSIKKKLIQNKNFYEM